MADAAAGRSRVTVLRGEAGVGKSTLLGYLSGRAAGWQVARAAGVESEMELPYAGGSRDVPAGELAGQVAQQRGLAHARLAPQDGDPTLAGPRISQHPIQRLTLARAAEELGGRAGILTRRRPPCTVRRLLVAGISRAYIRVAGLRNPADPGAVPGCLPGAMQSSERKSDS